MSADSKTVKELISNERPKLVAYSSTFSKEILEAMTQELVADTTIKNLRIVFSKGKGKNVADLLKNKNTIMKLSFDYLDNLYEPDSEIDFKELELIANALADNKALTLFSWTGENHFHNEHLAILLKGLQNSPTLRELNFALNQIDEQAWEGIAEFLKNNQSITSLDLSGNFIHLFGEEFEKILDALKQNTFVTYFNLNDMRSWRYAPFSSAVAEKKQKALNSKINSVLERNNLIKKIREDINELLPEKEENAAKTENDIQKKYQDILYNISEIAKNACPDSVLNELKSKALFAYCCWDGVLTTEERIKTLQELYMQEKDNVIKNKILTQLSDIALDEGMLKYQEKNREKASKYLMMAYTCSLHSGNENNQNQGRALSLWMEEELFDIEVKISALLSKLNESNKNKLAQFQKQYEEQCKLLGIEPINHLHKLLNQAKSMSLTEIKKLTQEQVLKKENNENVSLLKQFDLRSKATSFTTTGNVVESLDEDETPKPL